MDNSEWLKYWRISATSTLTNQNFFALGLPLVNTPNYRPYTQKLPRSQGELARQGYKNITLLWDELNFTQFKTLTDIVNAAITAGSLYATIDKADGTGLANSFIDIHGIPQPVDWQPVSNGRGVIYQNVTLVVTNITIDNDPSTVL